MKKINKARQPQQYTNWRNEATGKENEDYRYMPGDIRRVLLQALNEEQGYLCGYTMRKISAETSHVEHIKPESICREEERGSDLDYVNLIACHPKKAEKNKTQFLYGAIYKDKWWVDEGREFISPLNPHCELRFDFNLKGEIVPLTKEAKKTIEVLGLDHKALTEDRRRAIVEFIYGSKGDAPISGIKATQAIGSIVERNNDGSFYVFCIAIQKALHQYIVNLEKSALKRKFAAQGKKAKK
jgi:uncharacterized protein (TIGR02646 family)